MRLLSLLALGAVGALATASVKSVSNEKRISALVTRVSAVEGLSAGQIAALATLSTGQIGALAGLSASQLTAMATITASQYTIMGNANQTFLASLVQVAHLANDNSTTDTWDSAGRDLWNSLKASFVASGLMAP